MPECPYRKEGLVSWPRVGLWLPGLGRDTVISGGPPQRSAPQEPGWAVREKEAVPRA